MTFLYEVIPSPAILDAQHGMAAARMELEKVALTELTALARAAYPTAVRLRLDIDMTLDGPSVRCERVMDAHDRVIDREPVDDDAADDFEFRSMNLLGYLADANLARCTSNAWSLDLLPLA
jgi:hypothetical protein